MRCRQPPPERFSNTNWRNRYAAFDDDGVRLVALVRLIQVSEFHSLLWRKLLEKRNATVAVVGAGDFIGGEIAKKFASEGFTVFIRRRQGGKLRPLGKGVEAAGGKVFGRSLDARKEEE